MSYSHELDYQELFHLLTLSKTYLNNPEKTTVLENKSSAHVKLDTPDLRFAPQSLNTVGTITKKIQSTDECSICLQHFIKTDQVKILPCTHRYHQKCIDNWLEPKLAKWVKLVCPLCQQDVERD